MRKQLKNTSGNDIYFKYSIFDPVFPSRRNGNAKYRSIPDRLLSGVNSDWLYPFILVMLLLAAVQLVVIWARTVYSLKINGKLAVIGSTSYMWKVLRLPMEFFSQRLAGDIQSRASMNASIASTRENFRNTAQLIDPSRPVVFISSDYHMDRAVSMAKEAGVTQVMRLPAPSDPIRYGANVMWEVILEINEPKSVLAK